LLAVDAIGGVERPAAHERDLHRREVTAVRAAILSEPGLVLLQVLALRKEAAALVVERVGNDAGGADLRHGRNPAHRVHHIGDEPATRLRIAVIPLRQIELRNEHIVLVEAEHAVHGPIGRVERHRRCEQ
jgi:hypothetical protein